MKQPKVGVIGLGGQSAFLKTQYFPAPGETVPCSELFFELGGKGYNQAVACARFGVKTLFVGAVGTDFNGKLCLEDLEQEGIETRLVEKDLPTAYAVITTVPGGGNTVQVCGGAAKELAPEDLEQPAVRQALLCCNWLLLQNELSLSCLEAAIRLAEENGIPVVLNPAPAGNIPLELLKKCRLITPNFGEAKALVGFSEDESVTEAELAEAFHKLGLPTAVITLGGKGAMITENGQWEKIPPFTASEAVDTTGAGDTFNGVLTAYLAEGETLQEACRRAAIAAGIGVTRSGARGSIPTEQEIQEFL